jgi:hypothetical protein
MILSSSPEVQSVAKGLKNSVKVSKTLVFKLRSGEFPAVSGDTESTDGLLSSFTTFPDHPPPCSGHERRRRRRLPFFLFVFPAGDGSARRLVSFCSTVSGGGDDSGRKPARERRAWPVPFLLYSAGAVSGDGGAGGARWWRR